MKDCQMKFRKTKFKWDNSENFNVKKSNKTHTQTIKIFLLIHFREHTFFRFLLPLTFNIISNFEAKLFKNSQVIL